MNKKFIIPIIGISVVLVGLISWSGKLHSQTNLPYPQIVPQPKLSACVQSVANEMALMRDAWDQNLRDMLDQENACSEMVDDAFESMRTYRCWSDYLCETVLFSARADPEAMEGKPITSEHIASLPGCVKPENVEIPGTSLKFLEHCRIYGHEHDWFNIAQANYEQCRRLVNYDFSVLPDPDKGSKSSKTIETFKNQSTAFIAVERELKACNGRKKTSALTNKLSSIIEKMLAMEDHMELLKANMFKFDSLWPCPAAKCD